MRIVIVTAGGAGMFCGSCMHDNTWVKALRAAGHDAILLPLYTPLLLDGDDHSTQRVFLGGVNVYLDSRWAWWRKLPRWSKRWLDSPSLLKKIVGRGGVSNDAKELGELTLHLLAGHAGPHRHSLAELSEFVGQLQPDVVCYSNLMLAAGVESLRQTFRGPVWCVLQGDDIFLDGLQEPYKTQAWDRVRRLGRDIDGFFVHSDFYRNFMGSRLELPAHDWVKLPLVVDAEPYASASPTETPHPPTVGYFARIAPEKGLDILVEAVLELQKRLPEIRLHVGGYLGAGHLPYWQRVQELARPLGDAFRYVGSPTTIAAKAQILAGFDVFSVPTRYYEPKGIFVLESWAAGVPVVQPAHGAFPELLQETGGGLLVQSESTSALADGLHRLLSDPEFRRTAGAAGRAHVEAHHTPVRLAAAAAATWDPSRR